MANNNRILIYQNTDGNIKIDVRLDEETVWLTQEQMATLFGKAKSTISEHIKNTRPLKNTHQISGKSQFFCFCIK